MTLKSDEINLITVHTKIPQYPIPGTLRPLNNENITRIIEKSFPKSAPAQSARVPHSPTPLVIPQADLDAEERQRTGRYLAVGVTLIMLFIAFYHTIMRHATVLAGLLAPAIIMMLYILWLLYFAKKKKRQVAPV